MTDSIKISKFFNGAGALKFLNNQLKLVKGTAKHNSKKLLESNIEVYRIEVAIKKLTFPKEGCGLDYYAIRGGKCKFADTYPPNGNIFCDNPNCKNV